MGQAKLLLPWPTQDRPNGSLMDHVLSAWTTSRVDKVVVVIRSDDRQLDHVCRQWPVSILQPESAPVDMKASVRLGLEHLGLEHLGLKHLGLEHLGLKHLADHASPGPTSRCFVAPADLPSLNPQIIDRLALSPFEAGKIVVPTFGNRQGHPALLPWSIIPEVFELSDDEGIDQIVKRHPKTAVPFPPESYIDDIDTPLEYQQALAAAKKTRKS